MIKYQNDLNNIKPEDLNGFFVGWSSPLSQEQHYKALQNSEFIILAIDGDKVVGFINALSDNVAFAFIPMLEVLPEYHGKGIGTKLMKKMLTQLNSMHCIDLTCDQNIQPFYEKFGMLKSNGMVIRNYIKDS